MKVRELIEGSTLIEGAARSSERAPRVTVILPTFRRGDSGLLARAISSILDQTLDDLELIIVDDASTDSTASIIAHAMERDARVSVIRHAFNIGLPAISEYEAFLIARGDRIAFAFDDTVFEQDSLRLLLAESDAHPRALIVGWVEAHHAATRQAPARSVRLGFESDEHELLSSNVIANSAVLAPRAVLDDVGLYDPHVSLARVCDYDLWLRCRRRVPLRFVDVAVGEEHGPATTDSLGATYPLDQWTADDRMRQERSELLRPHAFGDIDVFDTSMFTSRRSKAAVRALADNHRDGRPWMTAPTATDEVSSLVPRVLVLAHPIDASTQLVFEALRDDQRLHVRILDPAQRSIAEVLAADVLIASRQLRDMADWVGVAGALGLPVHFYLDDNLPLMRATGELSEAWNDYEPTLLRDSISGLDGMLASTEALAESFSNQQLHKRIAVVPISAPRALTSQRPPARMIESAEGATIAVGLFIGIHRLDGFRRVILPALRTIFDETGIRLRVLVPEPFAAALDDSDPTPNIRIEPFPPSKDCFVALRTLRDARVDVLAVPDSPTINGPYKTLHPLLSAALLGAELVAPDIAPYSDLDSTPGVELVTAGGDIDSWTKALLRAVQSRITSAATGVPATELSDRFDPTSSATALLDALGEIPAPIESHVRQQRLAEWYARELALTRVQIDLQQREPQRLLTPDNPFGMLLVDLHRSARESRRLSAFRRTPGALQRFGLLGRRGERIEISLPLTAAAYRTYQVHLDAGEYREARALVWSSALPGDLIGLEVVDDEGRILLHTVGALPRADGAEWVVLDARGMNVRTPGVHEVRVFVRTNQPAFLVEAVYRGRLGLRRPDARPLIDWSRA